MNQSCTHRHGVARSTAAVGSGEPCRCRDAVRDRRRRAHARPADRAPQWQKHSITDAEREVLRAHARDVRADPYQDLATFRRAAHRAWGDLSPATRQWVLDLAAGTSTRPELYLTNLPRPDRLPPTPVTNTTWERSTDDVMSEFVMMVFCTALGHPISYLDQRGGRVFHDVYPTRANAAVLSSQSSQVILGFHTEMFFHPDPPEFLMLHCLRADPDQAALTSVADVRDIETWLDAETRSVLRQPRFALDLAHLHGSYVDGGRPIAASDARPVIPIIGEGEVSFRFEPALTTPIDDDAARAVDLVEHAAHACAASGVLAEGGLLLVDNRRAAHARSRFVAPLDGTDRWLRRVMVGRGQIPADVGLLSRHDLELVAPWRRRGALFDTVAYPVPGSDR